MSDHRSDVQVGLFVLIGVLLTAMMILVFGGFKNVLADTYVVTAHFPNAAGTTEGAPVRLLGIEVGSVAGIGLDPETDGVLMRLHVSKKYDIMSDAPLLIKQEGFIANIYVEFSEGVSGKALPKDGSARVEGTVDTFATYIEKATTALSETGGDVKTRVAEVAERLTTLLDGLNNIVGDEVFRKDVKGMASNIEAITAQLKKDLPGLTENLSAATAEVRTGIANASELMETYNRLGDDARAQLAHQGENLDKLTESLVVTAGNIAKLAENLNDIVESVERGEGTVGKLLTEPDAHRSLVAAIDMLMEAAREFRDLAEMVKKHPDWLIKGAPRNRR